MANKYIYIIVGIVVLFIIILLYQKAQSDRARELAIQQQLAQNPNSQFTNNQGWFGLASALVGGFAQGFGSNVGKPKEGQ